MMPDHALVLAIAQAAAFLAIGFLAMRVWALEHPEANKVRPWWDRVRPMSRFGLHVLKLAAAAGALLTMNAYLEARYTSADLHTQTPPSIPGSRR